MDMLAQFQHYLRESYGLVAPLWGVTGFILGTAVMLLLGALRSRSLKIREGELAAQLDTIAREKAVADERARQLGRHEERLRQAESALRQQADAFQAQVEQVRGWLDQIAPPSAALVKEDMAGRVSPPENA
jgi:chromosome segregation ATPase